MDLSRRFASELLSRAATVRAAVFDVDGVLTDGRLWYGPDGEQLKAFHVLDGHGLKLLREAGVAVWVISGRDGAAVRRRLLDLGVRDREFELGQAEKLAAAERLLAASGLSWAQVAVIGDDWPDLPLLSRAAFSAAPPNAHPEVLARVHYATHAPGGQGAAREFCDLLLSATGAYDEALRGVYDDTTHQDTLTGELL